MSYNRTIGRITEYDAINDADPLFDAGRRLFTDDIVLDYYVDFANRLGAELDNYLAGWDETCQRRGLPSERRIWYPKV